MATATETRPVESIIWRQDLYPRYEADPATIQRYAESLEFLPPIEVNQHGELIDGYHRWTAHKKAEQATIAVIVTPTESDAQLLRLAIERNAGHGLQLSMEDKRRLALKLYTGDKDSIATLLSVARRTVAGWVESIDRAMREERRKRIFDMWLACATQEEIAEAVGIPQQTVADAVRELPDLATLPNPVKVPATYSEIDWTPPIYNVWTFAKSTNQVEHYGNSEQRILDNLLYLYTEPFDIVVDPFAGGGATIDVCRKRLRRYWVSDRKPIVGREGIRTLDVVTEAPSLNNRWPDVALTYLDPPYWKQAEGKYSKDADDLANMDLATFTASLAAAIDRIANRQKRGAIALLMQPTQWNAEGHRYTDHVLDLVNAANPLRLTLENRVSCPYSTQQCQATQVEWAKANRKLLVLTRELVIWRVNT